MCAGGFGGDTVEQQDVDRLSTQLEAVREVMLDGKPRTLAELAQVVHLVTGKRATEASVSARLRDLRKEKFGGYLVERTRTDGGLFRYRVMAPVAV